MATQAIEGSRLGSGGGGLQQQVSPTKYLRTRRLSHTEAIYGSDHVKGIKNRAVFGTRGIVGPTGTPVSPTQGNNVVHRRGGSYKTGLRPRESLKAYIMNNNTRETSLERASRRTHPNSKPNPNPKF